MLTITILTSVQQLIINRTSKHYWSFVRGLYRWPVDTVTCSLNCDLHQMGHAWWRHQMEKFSLFTLLAICAGNSPVPGEFPTQRPVTRNFDVFFNLRPNKLLSKQSWGWWFETPSRPLWRHRDGNSTIVSKWIWMKMASNVKACPCDDVILFMKSCSLPLIRAYIH